jgi:hypothetical protein
MPSNRDEVEKACRVSSRAAVTTLAAKEPAVTSQRAGRGFLVIRIGEIDALPSAPCLRERDSTFTESELVRDGLEELVDTWKMQITDASGLV